MEVIINFDCVHKGANNLHHVLQNCPPVLYMTWRIKIWYAFSALIERSIQTSQCCIHFLTLLCIVMKQFLLRIPTTKLGYGKKSRKSRVEGGTSWLLVSLKVSIEFKKGYDNSGLSRKKRRQQKNKTSQSGEFFNERISRKCTFWILVLWPNISRPNDSVKPNYV